MTTLERLLAEELPTGQWGGSRAPAPPPTSPLAAAQHCADLAAALNGFVYANHLPTRSELGPPDNRRRPDRHLHAVPDPDQTEEAAA